MSSDEDLELSQDEVEGDEQNDEISHDEVESDDEWDPDPKDLVGIALLHQIFPELSILELEKLHANHVEKSARERLNRKKEDNDQSQKPSSLLGQRIWKQSKWLQENSLDPHDEEPSLQWRPVELPDDFLRLPHTIAVRRFNDKSEKWYYLILKRLEERVLEQYDAYHQFSGVPLTAMDMVTGQNCCTKVVFRDAKTGLGMTLCESDGKVRIYSVLDKDGNRLIETPQNFEKGGPAMEAGVLPGDWLLGINGQPLLPSPPGQQTLLKDAVSAIKFSSDPVVLHFRHAPEDNSFRRIQPNVLNSISLLDTSTMSIDTVSGETSIQLNVQPEYQSKAHPFISALVQKRLLKSADDQTRCSERLSHFTNRARQWESFSSFRLHPHSYDLSLLFDPEDLPPSFAHNDVSCDSEEATPIQLYAPSTPMLDPTIDYIPQEHFIKDDEHHAQGQSENSSLDLRSMIDDTGINLEVSSPQAKNSGSQASDSGGIATESMAESDVFIPLMGVRKALCVRIVHHFLEDRRVAYTIWVFDVESGREWYAPVRYLRDFQDLRTAALPLCPSLSQLPFPQQQGWSMFRSAEETESEALREAKRRQLENFLRKLSVLLYTHKLHPLITEVSFHVQSFLGCDASDTSLRLHDEITLNEAIVWQMPETRHSELQTRVRLLLKRSIQRYVFRLFLLEEVNGIVTDFVDTVRQQVPKLCELEAIEAQGRNKLKERALKDLDQIQTFLDQMQTLILVSCKLDLLSISKRREFLALRPFMEGVQGDGYLDRIFREGVREQVEIEIYVPLRGVISRLLVNGWRHHDMEIIFKMNELKQRPQSKFRIPSELVSPSSWASVSSVLNKGVGMSTLPCAKLRAIVDSAKEISRVYAKENKNRRTDDGSPVDLGADDFLPIFIYCVVQAKIDRPCALCVLLRSLCEQKNLIGEVGYYLASFEAAITHIQEINLAD
mmetsp:Transcript_7229/g.10580  ORF Transcript_7229/g.10580 Transcript_7229/m.10580 type:complete len:949 (-) Transcript_7229:931-3777(-)